MVEGNINPWGAPFNPRPRRSIHDHSGCPFNAVQPRNMTRYGLTNTTDNVDAGVDQVDNVMSKPVRGTPPHLRVAKRTDFTFDDSEGRRCSTSLPTYLPSYYSVLTQDEDEEDSADINESEHSIHNLSNGSQRSNGFSSSYNTSNSSPILHQPRRIEERGFSFMSIMTVIVIALAAIVAAYSYSTNIAVSDMYSSQYNESSFMCDASKLIVKYNIDRVGLWQIQSGIATIDSKEDTGSFIFVYNSSKKNFNRADFDAFINNVSTITAKYLRKENGDVLVTEADYTNYNTPMRFMDGHKDGVSKSGVLLVRDVHSFPPSVAMAFHYFCDEYNPFVKKSAIFFTLDLSRCSNYHDDKPTHSVIELCLHHKWLKLPKEDIGPLLTRVINVVIDVTNAF